MKKICLLTMAALLSVGVFTNCNNLPPDGDKDFDGLINKIDPDPNNNQYQVRLKLDEEKQSKDMNLMVDYREFIKDGYNKNLSLLSSFLINDADGFQPIFMNNVYKPSLLEALPIFSQIGCQDITYLETKDLIEDPYDVAGIFLGHHIFTDKDTKYQIFFGAIHGYPARTGWISNFDVGAWDESNNKITDGYKEFWNTDSHPKWNNHNIHKGFDVTANRLIDFVDSYVLEHGVNDAQKVYIFAGHSRAGALANLMGRHYIEKGINVKAYCFNPPAVSKESQEVAESSKYNNNIFTFTNTNDIVSRVPCPKYWKFTRYGRPMVIDVEHQGKGMFESLFNVEYMGCTTGFLNIIEGMLADQSLLTYPIDPEDLSIYDSNNLYEQWHYPDLVGLYDNETFTDEEFANAFVNFVNTHLATSVSITGPTPIEGEYYCSWQSKGAIIINFLTDLISGCEEENYLQYYFILLNRVIMETITELTLEGELSFNIPYQIRQAHEQKIACVCDVRKRPDITKKIPRK